MQLRYVIPRLLAVVCVVDLALRFMSIDPLTFRAWEAMFRYHPAGAPFEPNKRYDNPRSVGDLTVIGNLREPRQYRPERWTIDAFGYRNAPYLLDGEVNAMLAGASFVVGAEVNDDETLAVRLTKLGNCVVYNAGSDAMAVVPDRIVAVARRLKLRNRLVIRLYDEAAEVPAVPPRWQRPLRGLVWWAPPGVRVLAGRLKGFLTVSPLRILSERALKALADDRILPNRYADSVVKATLANGDPMLFWAQEVNNVYRSREVALDYWTWLRDELRTAHLDLWVVLVPSKYTVYRPFLVDQRPGGPEAGAYLDRLERALRAAGIPVLNLTSLLSEEAARYLNRGEYLYWLDDIHWNPRGIALAAAAIRAQWPLTEASCSTSHPLAVRKPQDRSHIRKQVGHGPS